MSVIYADLEPALYEINFDITITIPRSRIFRYFGCTLDEIQEYDDVREKLFVEDLVVSFPNETLSISGARKYFDNSDWFYKMKSDLVITTIGFDEETIGRGIWCTIE